jgi:flagellar biosynthesis protein FlhG
MQISSTEKLLKDGPAAPMAGSPGEASHASADERPAPRPRSRGAGRVWAVGGGKGGVGKSLLTANVGITLAQMGKRVCVIDADLGGANLHSCLGVAQPSTTLDDFVTRRTEGLEELAVQTPVPNLSLISGAGHVLGAANPKYQTKMRLIRKIKSMDFDHVILDLWAGTGFNTLDFFLSADLGVLVCLPEPTSIDNLYRFVKAAFFRRLRALEPKFQVGALVQAAMAGDGGTRVSSPQALFERIKTLDPEGGARLHDAMRQFTPRLVVNQVRSGADASVGEQVALAARNYFGFDLQFVGYLQYDDTVWRAVRKRRPLLLEYPVSPLAGSLREIVARILTP